ncbi:MAG: NAD-dependent isocitrate dehydrogenase [Alphaproteobacteria bacterium]|nr:NAD-dependent isocitrate dehydrogenase [Alphaproteobacteria bacterium]
MQHRVPPDSNGRHRVTLIPGDWIGPETCRVVQDVLAAMDTPVEWDEHALTPDTVDAVVHSARNTGVVLSARVGAKREAHHLPPTVELRKKLGVWSSVRPVKALPHSGARFPHTDLYVIRETSEDIYAGYEHEVTDGVYEAIKLTTTAACERIARWAFYVARKHDRKKVTIVHKSNIMKKSDGLFLRTAQKVAEEFPEIQTDEVIVDALCMRLVTSPERFDVLLTGNLFGDIVSDLVSGIAGGITASTTLSYGDGVALFSNPHGRAPELVGGDAANPVPMLQAASYMLRHIGLDGHQGRLDRAVTATLADGVRTRDMGGSASTAQVRDRIIANLDR